MADGKIMCAEIDYGDATARFCGAFDSETVEERFHHFASQCFGIRKSIEHFELLALIEGPLPTPWGLLGGAATVLQHNGDTIVWDDVGRKIKSEWDR